MSWLALLVLVELPVTYQQMSATAVSFRTMAGGCWTLATGPAATVRATIARLRKQQQGPGLYTLMSREPLDARWR